MDVKHHRDSQSMDDLFTLRVSAADGQMLGRVVLDRATDIIANRIAEEFLATHGTDVFAKLSPEAVANMAVAEAGAAIHETLQKKWPDKIVTVVREAEPRVYQRGIFGGLRRIR